MSIRKEVMISIIVPVYNAEQYLERCVDSLVKQTYKNIEIILVDDGSTDGSLNICKEYEKRDKRIIIIHQKNLGQNEARRKGLINSRGKYVGFIDSDDYIDRNMYEYIVGIMEKNSCDLVTSGIILETEKGTKSIMSYDSLEEGLYCNLEKDVFPYMIFDFRKQRAGIDGHLVNKIFKAEKIKKVFENIDKRIVVAEDSLALYMYCMLCKSIYVTKQCFYHYDMKVGTASSSKNIKLLDNTYLVYQSFMNLFKCYRTPYILIRQLKPLILYLETRSLKLLYDIDVHTLGEWQFNYSEKVYNSKVVIYGAGICGQALYHCFIKMEKENNIVAWVDKEGDKKSDECLYPIEYPSALKKIEFDYLILAIKDEELGRDVMKSLADNYNIEQKKMVWEPIEKNLSFGKMYF